MAGSVPGPSRPRHPRVVGVAVVAVTALVAVSFLLSSPAGPAGRKGSSRGAAAPPAAELAPAQLTGGGGGPAPGAFRSAPAPAAPPAPPTGVGTVTLDLYDTGRPTVAHGQQLALSRHIPTVVRYPAVGPRGETEGAGARAAAGPWALVVFAHGYDVTEATYDHLLHAWAADGFVVAAPEFPLQTAGGPLDENDLANEPADISFVVSALLQASAAGSGPLGHLIDPGRIAVAGHSDGAMAALAAAFRSGDARIGPVVAMAGATAAGVPHPDPHHPLLVVQGTADSIDPPVNSYQVYSAAGRPRVLLQLVGAGHLEPIADDNAWRPVVEAVTIDFLSHYLGGRATISDLAAAGTHPGLSTIGGQV